MASSCFIRPSATLAVNIKRGTDNQSFLQTMQNLQLVHTVDDDRSAHFIRYNIPLKNVSSTNRPIIQGLKGIIQSTVGA